MSKKELENEIENMQKAYKNNEVNNVLVYICTLALLEVMLDDEIEKEKKQRGLANKIKEV